MIIISLTKPILLHETLNPPSLTVTISGKSVVIYNTYCPEGNYFQREEGKFLFGGKQSLNSNN